MTNAENSESIFQLVEDIKTHASQLTKKAYKGMNVNALPNVPFELELASGWVSRLINTDEVRDVWYKKAKPGAILPEHFHTNVSEIATVVSGACRVIIKNDELNLCLGQSITIPQGIKHEMISDPEEGCEMMVVYQPPLSVRTKITE